MRLGVQWTRQAFSLVQDSLTDAYYSVRRLEKQLRNTTKWLKNNCKHLWEYHGTDTPARPTGYWQQYNSDSDEETVHSQFPRRPNYFKCGGCDLSGGPLNWESCRVVSDNPPIPQTCTRIPSRREAPYSQLSLVSFDLPATVFRSTPYETYWARGYPLFHSES